METSVSTDDGNSSDALGGSMRKLGEVREYIDEAWGPFKWRFGCPSGSTALLADVLVNQYKMSSFNVQWQLRQRWLMQTALPTYNRIHLWYGLEVCLVECCFDQNWCPDRLVFRPTESSPHLS